MAAASKRSANFTSEEEQLLVLLVEKHKDIVECKKSGHVTWAEKEKVWKLIESKFNGQSGRNYRPAKTLKENYLNLKKQTKQKFSANRLNLLKTGGGTYKIPDITDVDESIKDLISTQIDGLNNDCDSDTLNHYKEQLEDATLAMIPEEDKEEYEIVGQMESEQLTGHIHTPTNWAYCARNLKSPISEKLRITKSNLNSKNAVQAKPNYTPKKYVGTNYKLMEEKLEFVRLQKEKFLEEHKLKIELLKKKIELADKKLANYK